MAATYNGKIVIQNYPSGQLINRITQDDLDSAIADGLAFGQLDFSYYPIWNFRFDDNTEIQPEDMVSKEDVPTDADLYITTEIALVQIS